MTIFTGSTCLRNALQLFEMVNLVAGDLMDDPFDGEVAVLWVRKSLFPLGPGQSLKEREIHPSDRGKRLDRGTARHRVEPEPRVLIEWLRHVPGCHDSHPRTSAERELHLRKMGKNLARRPFARRIGSLESIGGPI